MVSLNRFSVLTIIAAVLNRKLDNRFKQQLPHFRTNCDFIAITHSQQIASVTFTDVQSVIERALESFHAPNQLVIIRVHLFVFNLKNPFQLSSCLLLPPILLLRHRNRATVQKWPTPAYSIGTIDIDVRKNAISTTTVAARPNAASMGAAWSASNHSFQCKQRKQLL